MTDNARIVREALDTGGHAHRCGVEWAYACDCGAGKTIEAGYAALTALETELATAKADLARAREEERERIVAIITDPHNNILWVVPGSSRVQAIHADPRMIRAALAPEQKGE